MRCVRRVGIRDWRSLNQNSDREVSRRPFRGMPYIFDIHLVVVGVSLFILL